MSHVHADPGRNTNIAVAVQNNSLPAMIAIRKYCNRSYRIRHRGCRTKQLVRSLFSMKKYSRASKSPAVGVKYKYAKTYIFT